MLGDGLVQNLADAYRFILFNYTPGDEIYVFGFSRGAYTARSFTGLLSNCGILDRRSAARAKDTIELYRTRDDTPEFFEQLMLFRSEYCVDTWVSDKEREWRRTNAPLCSVEDAARIKVRYVGVWDTVGALGVPKKFILSKKINKKHEFHDTKLSPFVHSARHAVAIDELRKEFGGSIERHIRREFPGVVIESWDYQMDDPVDDDATKPLNIAAAVVKHMQNQPSGRYTVNEIALELGFNSGQKGAFKDALKKKRKVYLDLAAAGVAYVVEGKSKGARSYLVKNG